jgi:hypothetical protein
MGGGTYNLITGWAEIQSSAAVSGAALFRRFIGGEYFEGSVPLVSSPATSFSLPFDGGSFATSSGSVPFITGLALVNPNSNSTADPVCTAYGSDGSVLESSMHLSSPPLTGFGHTALQLQPTFPSLGTNRGILVCTSSQAVGVLGLRFFGANALSSLPVSGQQ